MNFMIIFGALIELQNIYKIGEIHVQIGLPTHYVNSAFTFVRTFVLKSI